MNRRSVLIAIQNISYARDTRMQLIARSLHAAGYRVDVVCPRGEGEPRRQVHDGVQVWTFRMPSERVRLGGLGMEYATSAIVMTALVLRVCLGRGNGVVHVCLPPPVLQPLCVLLRRLGRTIVVDIHDLAPELFELRYPGRSVLARLVRRAERWAVRAADHVIATNESGAAVVVGRCGVPRERVSVVRTGPDLDELPQTPRVTRRDEVLVGYVGNVAPQDGIENLVRAADTVVRARGRRDIRFVCIGAGSDLPRARALAEELGLDGKLEFTGRLPHHLALARLAACDICVQPDGKNAFTDSCTMIKTLEYMGLAKPVVAFDLVETRVSCGLSALYARGDSPDRLADLVVALADDPGLRRRLGSEGRRRIEAQLAWRHGERRLLALYDHLTRSGEDVQRMPVEIVRDAHAAGAEERRRKVHQL